MGRATNTDAVEKLKVKIGEKTWYIRFVKSKDIQSDRYGDCGYARNGTPIIRVRRALRGKIELNTLVHEVLHATSAGASLSEESVKAMADDIERVLWRRGYRRII